MICAVTLRSAAPPLPKARLCDKASNLGRKLLVQSHSKILQCKNPVGLWYLAENPETLFNFATSKVSSDFGGLAIFECVVLRCKGHQTVALSLFCLLSWLWQMGTD